MSGVNQRVLNLINQSALSVSQEGLYGSTLWFGGFRLAGRASGRLAGRASERLMVSDSNRATASSSERPIFSASGSNQSRFVSGFSIKDCRS